MNINLVPANSAVGAKMIEAERKIPQGLNRLRKKASSSVKCPKSMPQGLKPTLILWHLRHD
jgi:hypothetical protein